MIMLPIAVFLLGLPVLLACFKAFADLLDHMRVAHPSDWVHAGKPRPILFHYEGFEYTVKARLASVKYSLLWLFKAPSWCNHDNEAVGLLHRYRNWLYVWNLGIMPLYILALLYAVHLDKA